uniref:Uncharacterized protein n=1 Tax=Human betaherpesvirus 6 TaxID=10368 RepID=A0A5P9S4H6_9BETA|nr:hypothetical protein [Human betaherpesvirus 6]QFV20924.1 hypothetical protein [Human betaherpesvirus 6]QFV59546.1 hypothetical protein [Human betaherpesvirus 6]
MKKKKHFQPFDFLHDESIQTTFPKCHTTSFFFQRQRSIVLSVFHQTLESINLKYQIHL